MRGAGADRLVVAGKPGNAGGAKGTGRPGSSAVNRDEREEPVSEPKPKSFEISKWAVWEAYRRVKANKGAAGVDGESIEEFEQDLEGNLYKLWNQALLRELFPAAGARGGDTEEGRQPQNVRGADCRGQDRSDRRARIPGARGGAGVP